MFLYLLCSTSHSLREVYSRSTCSARGLKVGFMSAFQSTSMCAALRVGLSTDLTDIGPVPNATPSPKGPENPSKLEFLDLTNLVFQLQ